jgi:hypothetical protein
MMDRLRTACPQARMLYNNYVSRSDLSTTKLLIKYFCLGSAMSTSLPYAKIGSAHLTNSEIHKSNEPSGSSLLFAASFISHRFCRLKQLFQDLSVQVTVLIASIVIAHYTARFSDGSIARCRRAYQSISPYTFNSTISGSMSSVFFTENFFAQFCKPQITGAQWQMKTFVALVIVNQVCLLASTVVKSMNLMDGRKSKLIVAVALFGIAFVAAVVKLFVVFGFFFASVSFSGCGCRATHSSSCPSTTYMDCQGILSIDDISAGCSGPVTGPSCPYYPYSSLCTCSNVGSFSCMSSCLLHQPYELYILVFIFPLSVVYISMSLYEWVHSISNESSSSSSDILSFHHRMRRTFRFAADFAVFQKNVLTSSSLLIAFFIPNDLIHCRDLNSPSDDMPIFPGLALLRSCSGQVYSVIGHAYVLSCCIFMLLLQHGFNALVIEREHLFAIARTVGVANFAFSAIMIVLIVNSVLQINRTEVAYNCHSTNSQNLVSSYNCADPNITNTLNPAVIAAYPTLPCASQCSVRIPFPTQLLLVSLIQNVVYVMASFLQFSFKGYKLQQKQSLMSASN